MKVAKIIATTFAKRSVRPKTYLVGDPVGFFGHSQVYKDEDDIINLIKYNILIEKKYNPGVKKRDLIIVNNNVGSIKGNNFLKKLSGKKIPYGKIIICNRKNIGMSFGAYNYAFKKFKNDYDYFLFTEDDTIVFKNNYFKFGIDIFENNKDAGFVPYIHSTKVGKYYYKSLNLNKKNAISCHGATGLSSKIVLNKVIKKYGKLPHFNGNNYQKCITYGEVGLPNSVIKLGYKILDLPKELILTVPAYDLMNGIKYKKWPNYKELIFYYLKSYLYKIFSYNQYTLRIYLNSIKRLKNFI